jgi:hypothetical protein
MQKKPKTVPQHGNAASWKTVYYAGEEKNYEDYSGEHFQPEKTFDALRQGNFKPLMQSFWSSC